MNVRFMSAKRKKDGSMAAVAREKVKNRALDLRLAKKGSKARNALQRKNSIFTSKSMKTAFIAW